MKLTGVNFRSVLGIGVTETKDAQHFCPTNMAHQKHWEHSLSASAFENMATAAWC